MKPVQRSLADTTLWTPDFRRLCAAVLLFFAAYHLLTPVMPLYFRALGLTGEQTGMLVAAFMMSSLALRPLVGKFADEWPKKRLMTIGLLAFAACPLLYERCPWTPALWAARLLHGAGFALFYTVCSSWITQSVPPARRAEGIGYYSNAIKVAMGFAPGLGLWLTGSATQSNFYLVFIASSLLAGAALVLIRGLPDAPVAATGLRRGKWFHGAAVFPGTVMAANSLAFGALIPFVSLLAAEKNLHAEKAFYTVYALFLIFARHFAGRRADTRGRDAVILPGMAVVAASLGLFAISSSAAVFLMTAAVYGLGAGLVQPALMALAADRSRPHERGAAMATFTMLNDLGIAAGSYVMGRAGAAVGYGNALLGIALAIVAGLVLFAARRSAEAPEFDLTQEQIS